jgi:FTR1 family protein
MDALVVTLREGIEAALVIAILLAYLAKTNRLDLNRSVYLGLIGAVLASVIVAISFKYTGIDPENEFIEGLFYFIAAIFVATMVIWMWRTGRYLKQSMEEKLDQIVTSKSTLWQHVSLALFTFFMIFREGIETVLFLSALSLTSASRLLTFIAALIGLGMAFVFGLFFIRGSFRIDLKRFFEVTGVVLLILVIKLLASGIHEWSEVGLLPTNKLEFLIIGYIVRDSSDLALIIGLLILPAVLILAEYRRMAKLSLSKAASPVERRLKLSELQRQQRWLIAALVVIILIILVLFSALASASSQTFDPAPKQILVGKDGLVIDLSTLSDNRLVKLVVKSTIGSDIRILVVKEDSIVRAALDACQVCGVYGYLQEGDHLICKNCNAPIELATIGEAGGCNPIPLKSKVVGSQLKITRSELNKAQAIFK